MFHPRYRRYIQSILLVVPMTGIVTTVNTKVGRGFSAIITTGMLHRWFVSILVAFPAVLVVAPLATKLTEHLISKDKL